jgi:hypothetical protein
MPRYRHAAALRARTRIQAVGHHDPVLGVHRGPYINFHRPCAVAEVVEQANGKRRRVYRKWAKPFEIFSQIPGCESFLRPGISIAELESFARKQSDTEAAIAMQQAIKRLMSGIAKRTA